MDNVTIAQTLYESFNDRDFERGAALIAEGCEFVDVPTGRILIGPAGFRENMEGWATAFPDGRIEITGVIEAEGSAAVQFTGRGTNTGPLRTPAGDVPPTGRKAQVDFCDVLRIRDGKIVAGRTYYDSATMLGQLGLIPEVPVGATA